MLTTEEVTRPAAEFRKIDPRISYVSGIDDDQICLGLLPGPLECRAFLREECMVSVPADIR